MAEQPPQADLGRLVRDTSPAYCKERPLPNSLCRCPRCQGVLARYAECDIRGENPVEEYDVEVDRAIVTASQATAPSQEAIQVLAALLSGNGSGNGLSASELAALHGLPRVKALLEAGRALRHEDPQAMLRFAKLARYAADRLRMRDFGRHPVADLRALAWAELASAYRVCNELGRADHAMNRAVYWCQRGSRTALLLARVADLLASLLAYQRRFTEGRELLALVCRAHAGAGQRHLAGRALISQGTLALWEASPRKAIPLLCQGLGHLDLDRDPQLGIQALWNMVSALVDMDRFRSARLLLWRARVLFVDVIQPHRLRWLEAKILAGLEDLSRSESAFQQARAGFAENGQVYPAALVGLDLAAVWARQGRVKEVFDLAEEMIVTFRALRIGREAVAALLVLKRACQYGGQVLDLIEITTDLLRNLERQPARPRNYSGSAPPTMSPSS
jgi:tetratricopeptide (TPR) repeat protein